MSFDHLSIFLSLPSIYLSSSSSTSSIHNNHLYERETTEDKVHINMNKELQGHAMIVANHHFLKYSRIFQYGIQVFFYFCNFFLFCLKEAFIHRSVFKSDQVERKSYNRKRASLQHSLNL